MDETEYHLKIQPLLELVSVENQLAFTISCIRRQLAVWYEFDSTDDCLEECLQLVERNKSTGSNLPIFHRGWNWHKQGLLRHMRRRIKTILFVPLQKAD